jgi:hypothetical protein
VKSHENLSLVALPTEGSGYVIAILSVLSFQRPGFRLQLLLSSKVTGIVR